MANDWTQEEVEATVSDYFAMLEAELRWAPYNKTEHRRALSRQLKRRSDTAIERKHMNISAVLREFGHPWIDGYKPLGNYQQRLWSVVAERVAITNPATSLVVDQVTRPAAVPAVEDVLGILDEPPERDERATAGAERAARPYVTRPPVHIDYFEQEARNRSLGLAGEELVVRFEIERLRRGGKSKLADKVEHVPTTKGDGLGFDVLSFEASGRERLIEVKTTAYGKRTPFFVTRNELGCSRARPDEYHVYRLFGFRQSPRLFTLQGSIDRVATLDPIAYSARVG